MPGQTKNSIKYLFLGLTILSVFLPFQVARASILSDFDSGMADIKKFVNIAINQIRNDLCTQYSLSIANGSWKPTDIRARIGRDFCLGYKIQVSTNPTDTSSFSPIAEVSNTPKLIIPTSSAPTGSLPSPLLGDTAAAGNKLNSSEIIYWTNLERTKNDNGLKTLTENSLLTQIAIARVQDMFDKGYFAHISPTGDSAIKMAVRDNYSYISIGENIALGNFSGSRDLVNAWMNSPGHRANILNINYTEIGVAAIEGMYKGEKVWISAQIFGRPLSDCVPVDTSIKDEISKDKSSAESLNAKLTSLQAELNTMGGADTDVYNAKVAEYNATVKLYNSLVSQIKSLTATYNLEVQTFNNCIKSA